MEDARTGRDEMKAKIVLVGDAGVGKTSLVGRYVWDAFVEDYVATLGVVLAKRSVDVPLDDRPVRVTAVLWDTMGGSDLAATLAESYLRDARGVLAVCDASSPDSMEGVGAWLDAAVRIAPGAARAIVMNKSDLGVEERTRDRALRDGLAAAAPCYLTSAKSGENVREAFEDLAHRIAARAFYGGDAPLDPVSLGIVIDVSVRPQTVQELAASTGRPAPAALARADALVERGYLRLESMNLGADGRPAPAFTATGKTFPPVARAHT